MVDLCNCFREISSLFYKNKKPDSIYILKLGSSNEIEEEIRESLIELGITYTTQIICLYYLFKIGALKDEIKSDHIYDEFRIQFDIDSFLNYITVFNPSLRYSPSYCYSILSNFTPEEYQDQIESLIFENDINGAIKKNDNYVLHKLAKSKDYFSSAVCGYIFVILGVKIDSLNKEYQTPLQIALINNGALFSVLINLKIDQKLSILINNYRKFITK